MKFFFLFALLCFYSSAEAQQVPSYAVFCFAEKNLAGNYVAFQTWNPGYAEGCCLGGSGSLAVFSTDRSNTVVYAAVNCPPQDQYYPLTCFRGNNECQGTSFTTQAIGEAAVNECCGVSGSTTASFHLSQVGTVCLRCVYPAPSQRQLNQARAILNAAPRSYSPANVCVLVGLASLTYMFSKMYN